MNNKKSMAATAAYLRRRKQKILKRLKAIHAQKHSSRKANKASRELDRTQLQLSAYMEM